MILKSILSVIFAALLGFPAHAGLLFEISGKVLRIENKKAVIKTADGETRVPMKNLSDKNTQAIQEAIVSKKEIKLMLPPSAFQSETL